MSGRFAANEMQAVIAAAIAGYGIAQLPYQVVEASVGDGRLRRVLGDYMTPVGGLYAVYPSSRHVSPLVKAFILKAAVGAEFSFRLRAASIPGCVSLVSDAEERARDGL